MTRSADDRPLPPALSSMWRLCKLGYQHEPRLMLAAFVLSQISALPDALLALWLALLARGLTDGRPALVQIAALGLGVSAAGTWFLRTVSTRVQRRFRDRVTIALEGHVALFQATIPTLAHQDRPDYLDRILAATRHCTTILISHRFSTVRHADRICVLEHGRVIELGTHDELMAKGGRYRTMFNLQAQRFSEPEDPGKTYDVLT